MVFYGIANKQLIKEGMKVEQTLKQQNILLARKQLSMIVGRDTSQLDEHQIRKAVLETLAENLSDGVIAPLFYYAVGGIPLMFSYKAVNTLDSMIGYKNTKYKQFGWFAARLDDLANFIPARITALVMILTGFSKRGLRYVFLYGHRHASPNAGYPEAALAGILNCRFGGPNIYHGKKVDKPYIGEHERTLTHKDVKRTVHINHITTIVFVLLIVSLSLIFTLT
jgi:adenosylcobinamide-phosphate synthase